LTEIGPDSGAPSRLDAWYRLEVAKRRLVYTLQGLMGSMTNDFKFGYNAAPSTIGATTAAGF